VLYDKDRKRARGVEIVDAETGQTYEYTAKVIFLNASAFNSTWVLMNSATDVWEGGLGSSSGELGHNVMDHHFEAGAQGVVDGFEDRYYSGRRPCGFYIPRFRNVGDDRRDYLRGFGYQGGASRLDHDTKDKWGLPVLAMDVSIRDNERAMRKDMAADAAEMLEAAGVRDVRTYEAEPAPGRAIHEMGTARMGRDPKSSVLNGHNQVWDAPNVYVTDGACMTSASCVNPSLTYMALTARAADHAVRELKAGNL
jgi:choline dehydrogenase-like flavoprotein